MPRSAIYNAYMPRQHMLTWQWLDPREWIQSI